MTTLSSLSTSLGGGPRTPLSVRYYSRVHHNSTDQVHPCRLVYSPKINLEEEDTGDATVPEWKLQPKLTYDDDGDDQVEERDIF